MDLIGDIVRDFVHRSREELELLNRGLVDWRTAPDDLESLTFFGEILQSLQEMSGLMAIPELERLFQQGQTLLLTVQQLWPDPGFELIAELQELIKTGWRMLTAIESRQNAAPLEVLTGVAIVSEKTPLGGPPSPFGRCEPIDDPAISLTSFIVQNLADTEENPQHDASHMGARLARLIDEVMAERHQIREIFAHALSLTSEDERSTFLDQECAACPELRLRFERLLKLEPLPHQLLQLPTSELIRVILKSLRNEASQPVSEGLSVSFIVPDDELFECDVESTITARPRGLRIPETSKDAWFRSVAFPHPFGRYTLERELGRGAMGTVLLASDRLLSRQVALKLLRVTPDDGPENVERFYREARAMASLQHANLCPIYDFGEVDGQPYLTMAFIDGRPLSQDLAGGRPLETRYAVALARTLAIAIHQAHLMGIVHRDLKPANVMINKHGEPILMDFGLARRDRPGEAEITQQGTILGSPAYMAPEQVEGNLDKIGPATDVHALGVILYQMLSGRKPFDGSVASVLAQIHSQDAKPLIIPGDTDTRLDAICRRAMAKVISKRYASALDLAKALTEYLADGTQVRFTPDVDLAPESAFAEPDSVTCSTLILRPRRGWRPRWQWTVAVFAAFLGVTFAMIKLNSLNLKETITVKLGSTNTLRESH